MRKPFLARCSYRSASPHGARHSGQPISSVQLTRYAKGAAMMGPDAHSPGAPRAAPISAKEISMRVLGLISLFLLGCIQPSGPSLGDAGQRQDAAPTCTSPDSCNGNPCCYERDYPRSVFISCEDDPATCVPASALEALTTRLCRNDADCVSGLDPSTVQFRDCCSGVLPGTQERSQFCFTRSQASQFGYRCP